MSKRFGTIGIYFVIYTLIISIFYIHAYFYEKELNRKNVTLKFIRIPVIICLEIIGYTLLAIYLRIAFNRIHIIDTDESQLFIKEFIMGSIWRSLYFIGFSTGYVYILKSFEDRKKVEALERQSLVTQIEKQTLENDLVHSQNNYLRSQINPHFLFNTLNFIYNDARKKAPMAADAIMNLAEMMRYALKRPEASEMVSLNEEIEQIEHLINLHKLRTANTINLQLDVIGDMFGLRFPPLILLTLVENIFKHGNVTHSSQTALIRISYERNTLNITTINMINEIRGAERESHNVGIDNINKRLKNFYGDNYIFKFFKDPLNRFITEIDVKVPNPMSTLIN
ncbi:sensor histidine kinase [Pedobacter mucosus]|uniref:sensor histidine kinase n=1 Tax=Pedobacter mucosus TaxID=2895286 RepID=UPI001EE469A1|nr:sensor histidine kinase [Pedobacter mucosus]UKT63108.1 sensor histidine kinase [Pedobacter mucosus]